MSIKGHVGILYAKRPATYKLYSSKPSKVQSNVHFGTMLHLHCFIIITRSNYNQHASHPFHHHHSFFLTRHISPPPPHLSSRPPLSHTAITCLSHPYLLHVRHVPSIPILDFYGLFLTTPACSIPGFCSSLFVLCKISIIRESNPRHGIFFFYMFKLICFFFIFPLPFSFNDLLPTVGRCFPRDNLGCLKNMNTKFAAENEFYRCFTRLVNT